MKPRRPQRAPRPDPRAQLDPGPTYSRRTWPRHRRELLRAGIVPAALRGECAALGLDPHVLRDDFLATALVAPFDAARTHPDGWHLRDATLCLAMAWYLRGRLAQARQEGGPC